MKFFFNIFLFLSFLLQAQPEQSFPVEKINNFINVPVSWLSVEKKISQKEKIKLIGFVLLNDSGQYCVQKLAKKVEDFMERYNGMFHFVDINKDSLTDVIFSGKQCPGIEGGHVGFYINRTNSFKKIFSCPGKIVGIKKDKSFVVHNYPCCAMTINSLFEYKMANDSVLEVSSVSFHKPLFKCTEVVIPKTLSLIGEQKINEGMELRFGAQNYPKDRSGLFKTLVFAQTKKETMAKVYNVFTDASGQKWLFVKLNYSDILQEEQPRKTSTLGWIKAPN